MKGVGSVYVTVPAGVPMGSVLSPFYGIGTETESNIKLFADDSFLHSVTGILYMNVYNLTLEKYMDGLNCGK